RHDVYETEFRVREDGRVRWLEGKGRVFRDAQGVPRQVMGTVMEVTERRAAAEALLQALGAAESANEAKTSFLTSISHDIRTPLAGIIGLVEIMQQSEWAAGETQRDQLRTLSSAAETLLGLINNVLDVS